MITAKTCAVCRRPLGLGWLLCGDHWGHVPDSLAQAAIRYYGRCVRPHHGDRLITDQFGLLATGATAISAARAYDMAQQLPTVTSTNQVTSEIQTQ